MTSTPSPTTDTEPLAFAEATVRRLRDDPPPAPARPKPVAPTNEALLECAAKALGYKHISKDETYLTATAAELLVCLRAALARWGRFANAKRLAQASDLRTALSDGRLGQPTPSSGTSAIHAADA